MSSHFTDGGLASSLLFALHMQSGQGNEYIESLGLFNCIPFDTLFARIFTICFLKFFHLTQEPTKSIRNCIRTLWGCYSGWWMDLLLHAPPITTSKYIVLFTPSQVKDKLNHPIFGLSNNNASFRLSGLIVLECPPYKYLRCPNSNCRKFPPWVGTKTSLWRQTV